MEPFMKMSPDFNRKSIIMRTDKVYECEIINIVRLTDMEKLFHLRIIDPVEAELFKFKPGQFVMVELPGFGEMPISLSGSTQRKGHIGLCVRKSGKVTGMLHKAAVGAKVGIRGPFGTFFPMERMAGNNILLIAGGLGLAPLRGPIYWVNEHRSEYKDVYLLYGTKKPDQILFDYQFDMWARIYNFDIRLIVEEPDDRWKGKVGLITKLFDDMIIDTKNTYAIVCGPPVMFKFVCAHLNKIGLPMDRMFVDLERRMHCGMGKCCRCMVGSTFTCVDGPVMDYWTVMNLKEAI
jgi:NAD(P)H-flavin reductase